MNTIKIHATREGDVHIECESPAQAGELLRLLDIGKSKEKHPVAKSTPATDVASVSRRRRGRHEMWSKEEVRFIVQNLERREKFFLRSPLSSRHARGGVSWMYYFVKNALKDSPKPYGGRRANARIAEMVNELKSELNSAIPRGTTSVTSGN